MGLILLTIAVVAVTMLVMAVGAIFSNRCLRGSCGGPEVIGPDGMPLTCDTCPLSRGTQHTARTNRRSPHGGESSAEPNGG